MEEYLTIMMDNDLERTILEYISLNEYDFTF